MLYNFYKYKLKILGPLFYFWVHFGSTLGPLLKKKVDPNQTPSRHLDTVRGFI